MQKNSTVSVALCTFNGQKYLKDQLESIASQTILPDEVVICDDCSTDRTIEIARQFAKNAPFDVHIFENTKTLRVTKNFEKALNLCQNEILFLCDQDDIWYSDKIKILTSFLDSNPECQAVFSDAELIDENAKPMSQQLWDKLRFWDEQQKLWQAGKSIDVLLQGNRVTGCTVAFRKSLLNQTVPFPTHIPEFIHDTWIAMAASVQNTIQFCPVTLTGYRQHAEQQIGTRPKNTRKVVTFADRFTRTHSEKIAPIVIDRDHWQGIYDLISERLPQAAGIQNIRHKLNYLNTRTSLPANRLRRIVPVFRHLFNGNYIKYADQEAGIKGGLLTLLSDLLE
jgi:hypothetical protein